jgi:hypothetical protein
MLQICVDRENVLDESNPNDGDSDFLLKRVACLKIYGEARSEGNNLFRSTHGMAALLKDNTSGVSWLTTTRHNCGIISFRDFEHTTRMVTLKTPGSFSEIPCFHPYYEDRIDRNAHRIDISSYVDDSGTEKFHYRQTEEGPERVFWVYGYDVIRQRFEDTYLHCLRPNKLEPFEIVDPGFEYTVGLRIIVALWNIPPPPEAENEDVSLYGERENINVRVGRIIAVGDNHIEYDCNTFPDYSGSPVICMDERFPEHRRKVIAIHAGSPQGIDFDTKEEIKFNFGFKTRCEHPNSFRVEQAIEDATNETSDEAVEEEANDDVDAAEDAVAGEGDGC